MHPILLFSQDWSYNIRERWRYFFGMCYPGLASFFVQLGDVCSIYARCGAYGVCNFNNVIQCSCLAGFEAITPQGLASGCVKKRKYQCGKEAGQGFLKLPNMKIPDASSIRRFGNLSLQECEQECLRDSNCIGYASTDINGGLGCLAYNDELKDKQRYKLAFGQDFYLRVNELDLAAHSKVSKFLHKKQTPAIIVASFVLTTKTWNGNPSKNNINMELTFFDLETIIAATDNFSPVRKLGQGGFGPVYKSQLCNGQEIAIKRLSKNFGQGMVEFKNEVLLIAKLQHRNLVRLIGCCIEEEKRILIFEYMPNRSLDYFIFDQSKKEMLN
ncbi:hypothetical protein SLA2020_415430 [Shorea laevis]